MAKGESRRQGNSAAFFPQWIWEWIDVKEGEAIEFQDENGVHGHYITFWKKEEK